MWVNNDRLEKINNILENDLEGKQKILICYFYISNNLFYLLNDDFFKKVVFSIKEMNLKDLSEIIYFFFEEVDIFYSWNNLKPDFKNKYKNIYETVLFIQSTCKKVPVFNKEIF